MPIVVNGTPIPEHGIETERQRLALHPDFKDIADPEEKRAKLQQAAEETAINRVLMAQFAARDPRPVNEQDVERERAEFLSTRGEIASFDPATLQAFLESRVRLKRTVNEIRKNAPEPSEEAMLDAYRRFGDSLQAPPRIRASHIVKHTDVNTEEEARAGIETAKAELEKGRPFDEVAAAYSDCPGNGGDLGWFPRDKMVPEFDKVVFGLEPGQTSGVFQTPLGFHIALVTGKREAGPMDLEEARVQIAATLRAMNEHEALRAQTMRLRAEAEIQRTPSSSNSSEKARAAGQ